MNEFKIVGLGTPTDAKNAVTKEYMDANTLSQSEADAKYEKKGTSTGGSLLPIAQDLSLNNHKITQLKDPTNPQDASTKAYVDSKPKGMTKATADTLYLGKGGGQFQGNIHFLNGGRISHLAKPLNATEAASKSYVDSKLPKSGLTRFTADNRYLSLNGGGLKGTFNMNDNKISNLKRPEQDEDAISRKYADETYLSKTG